MVDRMNLVEKVGITTGTGWQMGLCVGNTGMPTSYSSASERAHCNSYTGSTRLTKVIRPSVQMLIPNRRECRLGWLSFFMSARWAAWPKIRR